MQSLGGATREFAGCSGEIAYEHGLLTHENDNAYTIRRSEDQEKWMSEMVFCERYWDVQGGFTPSADTIYPARTFAQTRISMCDHHDIIIAWFSSV